MPTILRKGNKINFIRQAKIEKIIKASNDLINGQVYTTNGTYPRMLIENYIKFGFVKIIRD